MSAGQGIPGNDKRVQFNVADEGFDADLNDPAQGLEGGQPEEKADYYDPVYFDSDSYEDDTDEEEEKQDADEEAYDARAGVSEKTAASGKAKSQSSVSEITESLESTSLRSPSSEESKKAKKTRPTISNEELLYDPDEDDRDEEWLIKKISANRPPGCRPEDIWTDAILSCPMCLTQLCFDCQQHEYYQHQFRAMFVENCRTIENELLRFPKEAASKQRSSHNSNNKSNSKSATTDPSIPSNSANAPPQEFKPSLEDDEDMGYHPVVCGICSTKVALVDQDEVYHFFNVIPTTV
ncbi:hypothetical protein BGZ83_001737 [Gryganskiella cystojenkinii]|nr:hypothetical protein BGZ83_001737 [Gryganskiella cystojenkinii]